jgi:hypothetical protein
VWGDGRLIILGDQGYIELRKYIDLDGAPGADHLFLVNQKGVQRIDCTNVELPYSRQLIADIQNRTETAAGTLLRRRRACAHRAGAGGAALTKMTGQSWAPRRKIS